MTQKLLLIISSLFNFLKPTSKKSFTPIFRLFCLGMFFVNSFANAATYYSRVTTGNFITPGSWSTSPTGAPANATAIANGDIFIIQYGHTITVTANERISSITIDAGGTLVVGGFDFRVDNTTTVSGTLTHNNTAGTKNYYGLVTINSGGTWNNTGDSAINFRGGITNNGTFNAGAGLHTFANNNQSLNGTLSIPNLSTSVNLTNTGTLSVSTTLAGGGTFINDVNAILNYGGSSIAPTLTATASGNTVNYNASGNQTIKTTTYSNLTLSGTSTKTFGAAIAINNLLAITTGVVANLGSYQHTAGILTLGGAGPLTSTWGHTSSNPVAANTNNTFFANNTGRIAVAGAPYSAIDNNFASFGTTGQITGIGGESIGSLTLTAPAGNVFINVKFASYGLPGGTAPNFTIGSCHAFNSRTVTTSLLGNTTATIPASGAFNDTFGDPCYGVVKNYYVVATYATPICSGSNPSTIIGSTPTGGNGTYTYLWEVSTTSATAGYSPASGVNTGKDYTISGTISQKTWYRRTVTSGIYSDPTIVIIPINTPTEIVAPTSASASSTSICNGTPITLTVNGGNIGSNTGGYAEWTSGSCNGTLVGRSTLTNGSLTVTPTANTTYYVKYKNACGETSCGLPVTVTNPTSITLSTNTFTTCFNSATQNLPVGYSATAGTPTSYSIVWDSAAITAGLANKTDIANTFTAAGASGTITNAITIAANIPAGTYNGTLTVKTGSCTSFGRAFTLTINPSPVTPTASVTTQPDCTISTGTITVSSPASGTGFNYSIDGTTYTNTTGIFSGLAPTTYNVTARNNTTGCISAASSLTINPSAAKTWNGSSNTDWNTAANWTPTGVPTASDCVVIPNTTNKPVISGTNANFYANTLSVGNLGMLTVASTNTLNVTNAVSVNANGSLIFNNHSSLYQTNTGTNINTGNITYRRDTAPVRRYDFTFWSVPVTATPAYTLANLSPATLGDKYYSFEPNTGWIISYNGALPMSKGIGYMVRAPQTYDINTPAIYSASFVGVPTNGDVTIPAIAARWNLIGNPYPSAINANILMSTNSNVGSLYFWTHNLQPSTGVVGDAIYNYTTADYAVYNASGGTATANGSPAPTGRIAAGQAFFTNAGTGTSILFTNNMRVTGNNTQFYKTTDGTEDIERNRIWLNFSNKDGAFKQALVAYIDGATNNWDNQFDAATIDGNTYVDFYSINNNSALTIQARALPFENSDLIPLGYKTSIAGDFTIAIDHTDGLFTNQAVYLEDKTTNTIHDLREGDYKFNTQIGTFSDRFTLRYTNKTLGTGDFENVKDGLLVSVKDKVIKVTSSKETIKEVSVFEITGKLLYNKKKVGTTEFSISNLQAGNQVLLVKVTLDNNAEVSRKIIFK